MREIEFEWKSTTRRAADPEWSGESERKRAKVQKKKKKEDF